MLMFNLVPRVSPAVKYKMADKYRVWHWLQCFPALEKGHTFSRTWHRLKVFPPLGSLSCFPALGIGNMFPALGTGSNAINLIRD